MSTDPAASSSADHVETVDDSGERSIRFASASEITQPEPGSTQLPPQHTHGAATFEPLQSGRGPTGHPSQLPSLKISSAVPCAAWKGPARTIPRRRPGLALAAPRRRRERRSCARRRSSRAGPSDLADQPPQARPAPGLFPCADRRPA